MANRLAGETSPYLLQHAENPVDWYPWSEEALATARAENKPILLSIGYSACHWCHVMAHESFENTGIARIMNENFINIKVDREERPDLDTIYMDAVQSITGRGGWPLTVFLTPEGKPFYGGTYFPPEDRQGLPGFPRILQAIVAAYRDRRQDIESNIAQIIEAVKSEAIATGKNIPFSPAMLGHAYSTIKLSFDSENGGFGTSPKFPQPMTLEFLLRHYHATHDREAIKMVTLTLEKMAAGGVYDQLGGGFHRYATDNIWLVPHFEKMLYDNALLSGVYLRAFQITGRTVFRRIAEETIDYVLRDMTGPEGGFYSTRDADSEGEEGKYYLWTPEEVAQGIGEEKGKVFNDYYNITARGNFEGHNILHIAGDLEAELPQPIKTSRLALLKKRQQRSPPARDEKVIASWNGLMLSSLVEAASVLGRSDYREAAVKNGSFLLTAMTEGQFLMHTWKDHHARVEGFLDDYAMVIEALLDLHQATFSGKWLIEAIRMAEIIVKEFWDESTGKFFDSGKRHQELFTRPRNIYDAAVPSGPAAATMVLLKIARITGRTDMEKIAARSLKSMVDLINLRPLNFCKWLCGLDLYFSKPQEIVITGHAKDADTKAFMRILSNFWLPNKILVAHDPLEPSPITGLEILKDKKMINDRPTVFICEHFSCQAPITSPDVLAATLDKE